MNNNEMTIYYSNEHEYFMGDNLDKEFLNFKDGIMISKDIRFNNYQDYFKDREDEEYIMASDDKFKAFHIYLPKSIPTGKRNTTIITYLNGIKHLNPKMGYASLLALSETANKRCQPKLESNEIDKIINTVLTSYDKGESYITSNNERRFVFNKEHNLSFKDKMNIVNKDLGKLKTDNILNKIETTINEWDFKKNGIIKQTVLRDISGVGLSTIKKYWSNYKLKVKEMNTEHLKNDKITNEETIVEQEIIEQKPLNEVIDIKEEQITVLDINEIKPIVRLIREIKNNRLKQKQKEYEQ